MVEDKDETLKAMVSCMSLDDRDNRLILADRIEELGRSAEAKLLRSQHPVRYNHNAPGVSPMLTAGEYIEPTDDEEAESGLRVFWGDTFLGTIEATLRKGVSGLSHHWHKKEGETDRSWFLRVFQLDLDEQETLRVTWLLRLACDDLYKATRDDEDW